MEYGRQLLSELGSVARNDIVVADLKWQQGSGWSYATTFKRDSTYHSTRESVVVKKL